MTPRQLEILQHTLGADKYGRRQRYGDRNYFCAGARDESDGRELVALGYMRQHKTTEWLPYFNCSATDAGIKAMREGSPNPPKLTRSQLCYRRFCDADVGCSFREWLKFYDRTVQE
jgi:hypothetical protein